MNTSAKTQLNRSFQVRFCSLFRDGYALAFPCDERGRVPLDRLSERARNNYLYARAMVGRDFELPRVCEECVVG